MMPDCRQGLHWLPIAIVIILPFTFLLSYAIAVALGHVEPDFPYISDTGTKSPESCIFGQLLNISAVLIGITAYVRYKQVEEYNRDMLSVIKLNNVSIVFGMLSALGISMVGNFQETNVLVVHLMGAVMAFGLGNIYCWMHTWMSYKMYPHVVPKSMCHLRVFLSAVTTVTFIATFTFDGISKHQFHGDNPRKWFPKDGGFPLHIASTASEWTMALSLLAYFTTFVPEFKRISMTTPEVTLNVMRSESFSGLYQGDDVIT